MSETAIKLRAPKNAVIVELHLGEEEVAIKPIQNSDFFSRRPDVEQAKNDRAYTIEVGDALYTIRVTREPKEGLGG